MIKLLFDRLPYIFAGFMLGMVLTEDLPGEKEREQKQAFEEGRTFERELLLNADSSKVSCLFGYIPDSLYKMNLPELRDSGSYKIRSK